MSGKKVTLKSSDGEIVEVDESIAIVSKVIKRMIKEDYKPNPPHKRITGKILAKAIEYCKKHIDVAASDKNDLKAWDDEFVKDDPRTLLDLILAADYLKIDGLMKLLGNTIGNMISGYTKSGKTVQEIEEILHVKNVVCPNARL